MPEFPDVTVYCESLAAKVAGEPIVDIRIVNPFVLRTVDPPIAELKGRRVAGVRRMGKRIVLEIEGDLFMVIHLMIAGRLRWRPPGKAISRATTLTIFEFPAGTLTLTEAGKKRRASMHVVRGEGALPQFDRGGIEIFETALEQFAERLKSENHTVKRSLTDPRLFSGIGNAYSDEILHRAKMSPLVLTSRLTNEEIARLYEATKEVLTEWTERLRAEAAAEGFPEQVTAFREGMAVHGRFGKPCPVC